MRHELIGKDSCCKQPYPEYFFTTLPFLYNPENGQMLHFFNYCLDKNSIKKYALGQICLTVEEYTTAKISMDADRNKELSGKGLVNLCFTLIKFSEKTNAQLEKGNLNYLFSLR